MEAMVVGGYCMWLVVMVWASLAALAAADTAVCTEVTSQSSSTSDSLSSS